MGTRRRRSSGEPRPKEDRAPARRCQAFSRRTSELQTWKPFAKASDKSRARRARRAWLALLATGTRTTNISAWDGRRAACDGRRAATGGEVGRGGHTGAGDVDDAALAQVIAVGDMGAGCK